MNIWISILLTLLPKLLEYLLGLLQKRQRVPTRHVEDLNRITWYADQIRGTAPKVGCAVGGVPPEKE